MVIKILNGETRVQPKDSHLVQRFIYHFENLDYHHATTVGLWACEDPSDVIDHNNVLVQINP